MQDLSDKIIDEIKSRNITPKPKWQFVGRDLLFWGAFVVSVGIGAVAFSAMLDRISAIDWDIYPQLGRNPVNHVFLSLPYLWAVVVVLFSLLAIHNFRHTKEGYRYRPVAVVTTSIVISLVGGTALFLTGFGGQIDERIAQRPPLGPMMPGHPANVWQHPESGLLAGEILIVENDEILNLRDLIGETWRVAYAGARFHIPLLPGGRIKIIGKQTGERLFQAWQIRFWRGGRADIWSAPGF